MRGSFGFVLFFDFILSLFISVLMLYFTFKLCLRAPFSPLFALGIFIATFFCGVFLVNLPRFRSLIRQYLKPKAVYSFESTGFNDGEGAAISRMGSADAAGHNESVEREYIPMNTFREQSMYMQASRSVIMSMRQSEWDLRRTSSHDAGGEKRYPQLKYSRSVGKRIAEWFVINRCHYSSTFPIGVGTGRLTLFRRFHHWIKSHWMKNMLHNPIVAMMSILFTICWCIMWEWAATFMTRDYGDYCVLNWSLVKIPTLYWDMEAAYQIVFGVSYLLHLYASEWGLKYIFSWSGLIDVTMTPLSTQAIIYLIQQLVDEKCNPGTELEKYSMLLMGPLRFLRLLQAEFLFSRSFKSLPELQCIVLGIATAAISLLFSFSGFVFLLESPRPDIKFTKPFDFIYFGVATMGTVGYGDFTPKTTVGRSLCIMLICTCISLGAVHFKRLKIAIARDKTDIGSQIDYSDRYVFFWGPISEYQLLTFCRCLAQTFPGSLETVVVATPLALEHYRVVHLAVEYHTKIKLHILGGSEAICVPSYIAKLAGHSAFTVIVNHKHVVAQRLEDQRNIDRQAVLMAIACLNITRPLGIPLCVQVEGSEYKPLLEDLGISSIFYSRDLKYKMFAKSIGCRGLFYLILTLFHTPYSFKKSLVYVEELHQLFYASSHYSKIEEEEDPEQPKAPTKKETSVVKEMLDILRGLRFQLFKLVFPQCAHGLRFFDFCRYLYKHYSMFLVGIITFRGDVLLNPVDFILGESKQDEYGLVIAESLDDVLRVSLLKKLEPDVLASKTVAISYKVNEQAAMPLFSLPEAPSIGPVDTVYGIPQAKDYQEALEMLEPGKMVLVCGWVPDMPEFLELVLTKNPEHNFVILAPKELVIRAASRPFENTRNRVAYIDGAGMYCESLTLAGIHHCICVIVLNSHQSVGASRELPVDAQVLVVRHLVYTLLKNKTEANVQPPHVIIDIKSSACLEYLDPFLIATVGASCPKEAMQKAWQHFGEFMCSYEIACGGIFVQDMFYGLLSHCYSTCKNAVSHEHIASLFDAVESETISLEQLPIAFARKTFKVFYKHNFYVEQRICIGICRTYTVSTMNEVKQLVIVAPQPSFLLESSDQVYIIRPSFK